MESDKQIYLIFQRQPQWVFLPLYEQCREEGLIKACLLFRIRYWNPFVIQSVEEDGPFGLDLLGRRDSWSPETSAGQASGILLRSTHLSARRAFKSGHCIAPQAAMILQTSPDKITMAIMKLGQANPLKGCPLRIEGIVANAAAPTPMPNPRNNCQPFSSVNNQTNRDLVNPMARIAANSARRSIAPRNCETPNPIVPSNSPNAPNT